MISGATVEIACPALTPVGIAAGGTAIGVSVTAWTPCVAGACRDVDTPPTPTDVDGALEFGTVAVTVVLGPGTVTVVVGAGTVTVGAGTVTVCVGGGDVTVCGGVGAGVPHDFEPWSGLEPPNGKTQS